MIQPQLFWKLVRFAIVGLIVMFCFMGLNWLFKHRFGAQVSFLLAYPPAVCLHFILNKIWTFGDHRSAKPRQVSEYLVMVAVTFAVQWLVFTSVVTWTTIPSWIAAGIANAAQMAITFMVMNRRIFAPAVAKV